MSDPEHPTRRREASPADPSPEMRRNRTIRRFRWLVLLLMTGAIAAVVTLYLSGRSDRAESSPEDELEMESMEPTGEMVTVGEGFERTVTEGDRELFTVRGERYAVDKEGVIFLAGVEVVIYREEGGEYRVAGEKARFVMEKRQGSIAGGVRIAAPDGMTLRTESLRVTDDGNQVRTRSPVAFEIGEDYQGTAEGLRAWIPSRRYLLEGLVQVDSRAGAEEPLHIQAKGLMLDRARHLLSSQDWAVLRRRGERLSALEMHFFFSDDERALRFVRAERKVTGLLRSGGSVDLGDTGARRIGFQAGKMTLLMAEDGRSPKKLDLERVGRQRPRVYTLGPASAPRYRLTAATIGAWFDESGTANRVLAEGGAVLVMNEPGARVVDEAALGAQPEPEEEGGEGAEAAGSAPDEPAERSGPAERRASAREAEASFGPDGEISAVEMRGDVKLEDGRVEAEGDRGIFQITADRAELEGRPARATAEQGVMEAPRILYTRESGILTGAGGARVRIEDARKSALGGSPLARGEGPVWVEAEQAFLRDQPRSFLFVGKVRAWRGDDLLVTDELRGDEAEDRLTATGGVRTLWYPDSEEGEAADGPIEVTSDAMLYGQGERFLVYTAEAPRRVKAEQDGRTVTGREITLTLAEGGGLERLVAAGEVQVDAPPSATGSAGPSGKGTRTLRGERAVYDPVARTVDVTAAPGGKVTLKDGDGNVVEGPRMRYDIESDRVRVIGREAPGDGSAGSAAASSATAASGGPGAPGTP